MPRKQNYQLWVSKGICPICCRRPANGGRTQCSRCWEQRRRQNRRHYVKNRSKLQALARRNYHLARAQRPAPPVDPGPTMLPEAPDKAWLLARIQLLEAEAAAHGG